MQGYLVCLYGEKLDKDYDCPLRIIFEDGKIYKGVSKEEVMRKSVVAVNKGEYKYIDDNVIYVNDGNFIYFWYNNWLCKFRKINLTVIKCWIRGSKPCLIIGGITGDMVIDKCERVTRDDMLKVLI